MTTQLQTESKALLGRSSTGVQSGLLQRKCACGTHTAAGGECIECRKKRLQRRTANQVEPTEVPPIVHEVLRSTGQPLDPATRAFFEPRFGHDFGSVPVRSGRVPDDLSISSPNDGLELEAGRAADTIMRSAPEHKSSSVSHDLSAVRVHTNTRAAESARSVNALAYSVGPHIVFGAGQYAPQALTGKHLLAHELTHVMQASGSAKGSIHSMFRLVAGWSNCPGGINSAPDDTTELEAIDARAGEMSQAVAEQLGARPPEADILQAYEDHFGLPSAVRGGFLNRLTGTVRATQEATINEELAILSRRFAMVARLFSQPIQYLCAGDPASVARARVPNCQAFAWSFRGTGQVVLCPPFWDAAADDDERAAVLLHEAFHIIWGRNTPSEVGEIRDSNSRGPGGAFVNAHCYDEFAAQLMGTTTPRVRCPAQG